MATSLRFVTSDNVCFPSEAESQASSVLSTVQDVCPVGVRLKLVLTGFTW
jgi:hypothetical protein